MHESKKILRFFGNKPRFVLFSNLICAHCPRQPPRCPELSDQPAEKKYHRPAQLVFSSGKRFLNFERNFVISGLNLAKNDQKSPLQHQNRALKALAEF